MSEVLKTHDATKHHEKGAIAHTPDWYALFGGNCPVCGVTPVFKEPKRA